MAETDEYAAAMRHCHQVAPAQAALVQARLDALEDEVLQLSQANPQARMVRDLYTLMGRVEVHLTHQPGSVAALTVRDIARSQAGQKLLAALGSAIGLAAAAAFGGGMLTGGG